jgi:multiple sugar transport system permease protein
MPLISPVGRKSWRSRLALAVIYAVLALGGLTMVYPFLLMAATGAKGPTDQYDQRILPAYWSDESELFRKYVDDKYAGKTEPVGWFYGEAVALQLLSTERPERTPTIQPLTDEEALRFERFLLQLPLDQWEVGFQPASGRFSSKLLNRYQAYVLSLYGSVERINEVYLEQNAVLQTVQPPREVYRSKDWHPREDQKWKDWLAFKQSLPAEFRIPITVRSQWQEFLRAKYRNRLDQVPDDIRSGAAEFSQIAVRPSHPLYEEFLSESLPERYRADNPDLRWRQLTAESELPLAKYDAWYVQENASALKREYTTRNYATVWDYIALHGRAVWNTILFCLLAVGTQLIVNPLAAWALSRYPMPATGRILLFLLATMAFPAEVTMIPSFLLLKDLGLLNTFAALVLPTAASGYSIYLLKGFFDSLPRDLFENASLEGAGEGTLLFRITLPLTKPVLAVIALTAFMGAYGAFLYAFLVAQDERMWTLMVWIYQLQSRAPMSVMMAALTLAALPTLVVFLFAQRVILRGIILPGEK